MKTPIMVICAAFFLGGCAVKYTPAQKTEVEIEEPKIGETVTAEIGDHMLRKGVIVEERVLAVNSPVEGVFYDIMDGAYPEIGTASDSETLFSADGVIRGALSDPAQFLSVRSSNPGEACVVTVYAARVCYEADIEIMKRFSEKAASFYQTLIYSGRIGNKINVSYREFSNSMARPAFNNDVEYDLSASMQIGYKGAQIEVINADNSSITYRVLRSFSE